MEQDGFCYTNSEVLINHKNTHNKTELAKFENDVVQVKATILKIGEGIPGIFNAEHVKQFHKFLFQEVYPWAGETRANRGGFQGVKDTQVDGVLQEMKFAPFKEIDVRLDAISLQLQKENNLKGLATEKFVERAAYYLDQYNHVHAFREGNGRTLQAAFTQLGKEAGYNIDFNQADPAKYNEARNFAIVKPHPPQEGSKNIEPLKVFLSQITIPLPGVETEKGQQVNLKTPEPSPALCRIEALRELEVTGTRIADRWDSVVKQQVKHIVEEPQKYKNHDKSLRAISTSILEGTQPEHYLYKDAERLTKALDQVKFIAAGKEIPISKIISNTNSSQAQQPKNHTEAKALFIQAATAVSRELKTHGKPAVGEGLQEVARFVEKVPYVGGKNKLLVEEALNNASSISGFKAGQALDDLKSANKILEIPEKNKAIQSGRSVSRSQQGQEL
ncbi:Fic/DOC family protein [Adhaeribacter aquaticus]|uniref:Fic/DOC family protein n=1 Tax=Adhaeribacter aquaticus TaxID=299567 RepID=UPI000409A6B6|nr:Fic family protein [Adhaeribacter aquaticus]